MTIDLPLHDLGDNEWIALQRSENVLRLVVGRQGTTPKDALRYIPLAELNDDSADTLSQAVLDLLNEVRQSAPRSAM